MAVESYPFMDMLTVTMQVVLIVVDPLQDGFTHLQVLLFLGDLCFKIVRESLPLVEYVAASEACKEAIWLACLVGDLGIKVQLPLLHCDSQSAIALAKNPVFSCSNETH